MSFLAPQFLWLLLALPLVVALHFVRSRRRRLDVSALFLWQQAAQLAERRRRFSPTWLLALQLLFVSLAALALAQPSFSASGDVERVLIIDTSASMAAGEGTGTTSRLERAKSEAADLMSDAGRVAIIRAGLDATTAQPMSDDKSEVRRALQDLTAADASADLQRAVDLAASVAPSAELHLFSDALAGVVAPPETALTFHPTFQTAQPGTENEQPLPQSPPNWGISAFDLRNQQIFVSVVSNSLRPQEVTLSVTRGEDDQPIAQTTLLVPSQGQANTSFPVEEMTGFYRAVLDVPEEDALTLDNEAFAGSRTLNVVVTPPTPRFERVLRILPGVAVRGVQAVQEGLEYDVLISSNDLPDTLAPGRYLFFRPPSEEPRYQQIADWDRSDPLLRFVDLTGVTVGLPPEDSPEGPSEDSTALPEGDWRTLAQMSDLSPAILGLSEPGVEAAFLRFHPSQTDLVRRVAFPILMTNLMNTFRGEPRLPLGAPLTEEARATEPGVYTVGGAPYSVSLLSTEESRLATSLPTTAPPQSSAASSAEGTATQRNLGLWLTLVALLVLVGEWLLWSQVRGGGWASRA